MDTTELSLDTTGRRVVDLTDAAEEVVGAVARRTVPVAIAVNDDNPRRGVRLSFLSG